MAAPIAPPPQMTMRLARLTPHCASIALAFDLMSFSFTTSVSPRSGAPRPSASPRPGAQVNMSSWL
jgi:hypothetical protein